MNCSEPIENSGAEVLQLAGALDTYTAGALRDTLEAALRDRAALALDLAAVESCDFSTLQLIVSARRGAERSGKPFSLTAVSDAVAATAAALGVSLEAAERTH